MIESGEDLLRKALAGAMADLTDFGSLTVVDVAAEGIATFDLHRDGTGTPRGRGRPMTRWSDLAGEAEWDGTDESSARLAVLNAVTTPTDAPVILVCSFPGGAKTDRAMEWLRAAHPGTPAFTSADVRVDALLREVITDEPLRRPYDLVVLRWYAATSRLEFSCRPLFAIEARCGDLVEFDVRCEPSDERGTVFAVVAWQDRRPSLVSIHTARLPPGRHEIVAELERPGRVRFHGLPGLVRDDRDWAELVALVPPRFDPAPQSAHLICAAEVGAADGQFRERLRRIGQMITAMSGELSGRLKVSLVTYATHSFERGAPEEPVNVVDWRVSPEHAQTSLKHLEERHERGTVKHGYPYAAQLEDMLAEVARRLGAGGPERTVLLTVGNRPPHPPRAHRSEILPCPHRHDWEQELRRLAQHPDLTFGAICDQPAERAGPVWSHLGRDALAHLDAVDVRNLGADLGLVAPRIQRIPFPLIETP